MPIRIRPHDGRSARRVPGRSRSAGLRRALAHAAWGALHLLVFGSSLALAWVLLWAHVADRPADQRAAWWVAVVALGIGLSCPWLALSWRLSRVRWGWLGSSACGLLGYGVPGVMAAVTVWGTGGTTALGPWLWPATAMVVQGVALIVSAREKGRAAGLAAALAAPAVGVWALLGEGSPGRVKVLFEWMTAPANRAWAGLIAGGLLALAIWWLMAVTGVRRRWAWRAAIAAGLACWPAYSLGLSALDRPPVGLARISEEDQAPGEAGGPFADVSPDAILGWRWVSSGVSWREALVLQPPGRINGRATVSAGGNVRLFVVLPYQWIDEDDVPVRVRVTAATAEGKIVSQADATFARLSARVETGSSWREVVLEGCGAEGAQVDVVLAAEAAQPGLGGSRMPVVAVAADRVAAPVRGSVSGPSVLFILVDALRADRLHAYGFPLETSPRIDALAAEGVLFERVVSSSSWTVPSVASLFTGTHVSTHKMSAFSMSGRLNHETLAQRFRAAGARTAAVSANLLVFPGSGLLAGFDVFSGVGRFGRTGWPRGDWVTDQAIALLRHMAGQRFFLYVHYMDPHAPYDPPSGWARFGTSEEGRYLGETLYCDSQVGRLLDELEALGRSEDTLVVFIADHGEAFKEHGHTGHGWSLHREEIEVPLILRFPGRFPAGRRVGAQVRSIDVHTTICALLGLPVPRYVEGESLVPLIDEVGSVGDREAFSELIPEARGAPYPLASLSDGHYKLILRPADGKRLLYDVRLDPEEQTDLAARQPALAESLEGRIRRFLEERGGAAVLERSGLSPAEMRMLRALGYLSPGGE